MVLQMSFQQTTDILLVKYYSMSKWDEFDLFDTFPNDD